MKDIRIVYMYNYYNIRLSVYCENIHVLMYSENCFSLSCAINYMYLPYILMGRHTLHWLS